MQASGRILVGYVALCLLALDAVAIAADELANSGPPAPVGGVLSPRQQTLFDAQVRPFLKQHCFDCHGVDERKAGLRLDTLGTDFLEGKTANVWKEVVDKINLGIMPPKDQPRPEPKAAFAVVEWVNFEMRSAEKRAQSTGGRVPMRRMNRTEYANTVRDLFHLDDNFARKIERELPVDGKVDGFDRGGAALLVDKSQLQTYMDVARLVVAEALPAEPPKMSKFRMEAGKDRWLTDVGPAKLKLKDLTRPGILAASDYGYLFKGHEDELEREVPAGTQVNDYTVRRDNGLEMCVCYNNLGYFERGTQPRQVVRQDGVYRCRIRAGASRGTGEYEVDAVRLKADYCKGKWNQTSFEFTIDAPLDQPQVYEQEIFLQSGGPDFDRVLWYSWNSRFPYTGYGDTSGRVFVLNHELYQQVLKTNRFGGEFDRAVSERQSPEKIVAAREKKHEEEANLREALRAFQGPVYCMKPEVDLAALPRLWYEYIELEGPYTEFPSKATKELFFNGESGDDGDLEYARRIFARFLPRAYRRPVDPAEVEDLVQSVAAMQHTMGKTFADAVRAGVATVLASPDFLYLQEPTGNDAQPHELTEVELANRLAYLLWSSMPDAELLELAARRRLQDPAILRAQVQRMIADPKSRQFVENFVGQWMRVREFETVVIDERDYKNYDFPLRKASHREPYEFFQELLRSNLSVLNLLDSDFVMINERLAKHYGIEGVKGEQFRRVAVQPDQHRGGILGMCGMLTYLSDGKRTMPVKRGAYLLDVLFNTPAPLPPPDAGDLPTVRNAKTVRERLEQHRARDTCASCHVKIDPLGLALENFDAIGAWRERQNGEGRQGGMGDPRIDPSGIMPNGKAFATFPEFKQILWEDRQQFLRAFTERLLAYALGRPVGVTDHEAVELLLAEAAREDYHLQALLQALVAHRVFHTK